MSGDVTDPAGDGNVGARTALDASDHGSEDERFLSSQTPPSSVVVGHMAISETEITSWATWMRAAGRPPTTIGLRTYQVRRVMRELKTDPWSLTTEELLIYLGAQSWAPETRRSYRASLRSFYDWAVASGRRRDNPAALLPAIRLPRGIPRPAPEHIYQEALGRADSRVKLMILLAAVCGLRRGEIARLSRDDVVSDLEGWSLRVLGKGGHQRLVPMPDGLARHVLQRDPGWLFPSLSSQGGIAGTHLTPSHVGKLVSAVLPDGWTCHTLRHRCATIAYASTRDLRAVQELLGHAKPETTMRYTQIPIDAVRNAVAAAAA